MVLCVASCERLPGTFGIEVLRGTYTPGAPWRARARCWVANRWILAGAGGRSCKLRSVGWSCVREIITRIQAPVDAACDLRCVRAADDAAASMEQNDNHDFRVSLIRVGNEPSEAPAHSFVVTGAGFSEILFPVGVVAALGRPVHHRREQPLAQVREQRGDVQLLPDARLKVLALFIGAGILQVELLAAFGKRTHKRSELEGRNADAFAEDRHPGRPPKQWGRRGQRPWLLFGDVITHALAEAEEFVVFDQAIETKLRTYGFKEFVVRVRHGLGKVHVATIADTNHRVTSDDAFLQTGERNKRLNRGARLEAGGERHFLVDDREDAAGRGIDGDY